jgi:hypothetical protein
VVLLIGLAAPTSASAEHRTIHLDVESLSVRHHAGHLVVDYRVGGEHWRWARSRGVGLRFEVRPVYRSRGHRHTSRWHRAAFSARRGTLRIPWPSLGAGARGLKIRIVSAAPSCRVDGLRFGGLHHSYLRLARATHGHYHYTAAHHRRVDGDDLDELLPEPLVDACDRHTLGSKARDTCLNHVQYMNAGTYQTADILRACAEHNNLTDDYVDCVEMATWFHSGASSAIRACAEQTSRSSYFNKCVHWASHIAHRPDTVVRTCGRRHGTFDANAVACIETAAGLEPGADKTVAVCDRLEKSDHKFEACLDEMAKP